MATYDCATCAAKLPLFNGPCGNYGADKEGRKHCPDCCAASDAEAMRTEPRFTGYLASTSGNARVGLAFTTWHGRVLGTVVHVGASVPGTKHGPFGERHYVRVRDRYGADWHGTGAPGMYCNLRRIGVRRPGKGGAS